MITDVLKYRNWRSHSLSLVPQFVHHSLILESSPWWPWHRRARSTRGRSWPRWSRLSARKGQTWSSWTGREARRCSREGRWWGLSAAAQAIARGPVSPPATPCPHRRWSPSRGWRWTGQGAASWRQPQLTWRGISRQAKSTILWGVEGRRRCPLWRNASHWRHPGCVRPGCKLRLLQLSELKPGSKMSIEGCSWWEEGRRRLSGERPPPACTSCRTWGRCSSADVCPSRIVEQKLRCETLFSLLVNFKETALQTRQTKKNFYIFFFDTPRGSSDSEQVGMSGRNGKIQLKPEKLKTFILELD